MARMFSGKDTVVCKYLILKILEKKEKLLICRIIPTYWTLLLKLIATTVFMQRYVMVAKEICFYVI